MEYKQGFARELTNRLSNSDSHIEIIYLDSLQTDSVQASISHNIRYKITGIIEVFDIIRLAEISPSADEYRESATGKIKLKIKVTDTRDGGIFSEESALGEVSQKSNGENTWESIGDS